MLLFPILTVYFVDGVEASISAYYCVWRLMKTTKKLVVNNSMIGGNIHISGLIWAKGH